MPTLLDCGVKDRSGRTKVTRGFGSMSSETPTRKTEVLGRFLATPPLPGKGQSNAADVLSRRVRLYP